MVKDAAPNATLDLADFFARYVAGADDLPLADWLARAGITLKPSGERRVSSSDESAQTYSVEQIAHPSDKQLRIRDGLLKGTVDRTANAAPAPANAR